MADYYMTLLALIAVFSLVFAALCFGATLLMWGSGIGHG
jgi:hypothetical protein